MENVYLALCWQTYPTHPPPSNLGGYAVGGLGTGGDDMALVERYSIGAFVWESVTPLGVPRRACGAVACGGSLLVLGFAPRS